MKILWRDRWLCAIDKPCGLMVHRSNRGTDTTFALQQLRDRLGQRVWPIHRLDRATSGVLLFALDPETAAVMGHQMMDRTIAKRYLAVVRGYADPAGVIDHPLPADGVGPLQPATTRYARLCRMELPYPVGRYASARYSLLEVLPETGRTHQIRRHLKHVFHPVIGDTTYGEGRHNRLFRELFACNRLLLHASNLAFDHPSEQRRISLAAPLSGVFRQIVQVFIQRDLVAAVT
ncbi:MAG: pseudouridine synthase [Wenzhouxiangella sp.]